MGSRHLLLTLPEEFEQDLRESGFRLASGTVDLPTLEKQHIKENNNVKVRKNIEEMLPGFMIGVKKRSLVILY